MARRVVVTGIGLICSLGNTTGEVWQALQAGKSGVSRITAFDTSAFACQIAAEVRNFNPLNFIEKKEIKKMGRFIHFAIAAADEAFNMPPSFRSRLKMQRWSASTSAPVLADSM